MAALLRQAGEEAPEVALQAAFDLAALGDQGLVTALLQLLGEASGCERVRRVLRGEVSRQL